MSESKIIGAFFDFDGTLLSTVSGSLLIKYLWNAGELSVPYVIKMGIANVLLKLHLYSRDRLHKLVMQVYKGQPVNKFENLAEDFYLTELKPHFAGNIVDKLIGHQQQGHEVVIVSASFRYYLTYVVKGLGVDHLLCSDLEVGKDGLLTGITKGESVRGTQKAVAAAQLASQLGIDLAQSYAYGDHITDVSILQLVGHPVAVEPEPKLRKVADQNNWEILQF